MQKFTASRISGNDNSVFPDILEIGHTTVIYFKGTVIGYHKTIVQRNEIASTHILSGLMFADIVIETIGGMCIRACGFWKNDARTIISLLN